MIYFYYGDEEYNISVEIKKLKSSLDKNFLDMSYKEYNNPKFADLIFILSSQPMMFGKMLVVIDCVNYFKTKKNDADGFSDDQIKQIEDALNNVNENLDVVFRAYTPYDPKKKSAIDKRKKIFKILSKYNSKEFNQIPIYKTAELEAWIKNQCKKYSLKINSEAVSVLLLQVGANLRMLDSEIQKLCVYANNAAVTKEMVKEICVNNDDLFAFIDFIITGAIAKAIEQYNKLIITRYPLSILAILQTNLRDKIYLKSNAERCSQDELAKLIGMHPYRVKLELQKLKNVSLKNLVKLKKNLTSAEYKIKSGQSNLTPEREIEYALLQ